MMKFLGGSDRFITGIPARDLDATDWAELTPEQRAMCIASGLYTSKAVEAAIADAAPIEPAVEVIEPAQPIESTSEGN